MMLLRDAIKGLLEEAIDHEISLNLLNTWAPVTLWYQACQTILQQGSSSFEPFLQGNSSRMSEENLKRCLSQHPSYGDVIQSFDAVCNQTGILKIQIGRDIFLYVTHNKETLPDQPSIDQTFHSRVDETTIIFQKSLRRLGRDLLHVEEGQTRNNKRRNPAPVVEEEPNSADPDVAVGESPGAAPGGGTEAPYYWVSLDARNLFGARPQDVNVLATIRRKIEILQNANQRVKGYKLIIEGGDPQDQCTESDIHQLRQRSLVLILVYKCCICRMGTNEGVSFETCIQEVLHLMANTGVIDQATHFVTVQRWNRIFRKRELWPHPRGPPGVRHKCNPPIFEVCPAEAKTSMMSTSFHDR